MTLIPQQYKEAREKFVEWYQNLPSKDEKGESLYVTPIMNFDKICELLGYKNQNE